MGAQNHLYLRLRGKSFYADSTSILMEDLGITAQSLRAHLKARTKFLRAKERVDRLKRLVTPLDQAPEIDRKMMAAEVYDESSRIINHVDD